MSSVTVSIVCTNYNKGKWIAEAIDSFLIQDCSFSYEILLIDDASTDESKGIIKDYAEKYPKIIRAFYNKKNLGITKTWIKICKEARGKYIARCDGDDYWIDEHKLQKQVNLLESSADSQWCCTDYDVVTGDKDVIQKNAVESGFINRPKSYAEQLVTKG
ncbi:glycosyltransferase, partial [Candidatus Saccharibacteria bacterium]|nr:glycosyltransferase [Candidatus Saccharibacteria bacterium]